MEFGLARLVLGSNAFVPISEEEYKAIAAAKTGISEATFIEQKFDVLLENYSEVEVTLLQSAARSMVFRDQDYSSFQAERNLFNRRLINFLTAARTYRDQTRHHISTLFAAESEVVSAINSEFSRQHDLRLGYRAMEALRNFVQHRGFPVHAVSHVSQLTEDGKYFLFTVAPYLVPDELRADPKFTQPVLQELSKAGEKIDLRALVRDYVEGLWNVHNSIRGYLARKVETWEATLENAITQFKRGCPDEDSILGLAALIRAEDGQCTGEIQLFEGFLAVRRQLCVKNANLQNLGRRYVTSRIVD